MNKFFLGLGIIIVVTAAVLIVFGQPSTSNNQSSADTTWHTDLNSALQDAKNSDKPVFIDFYADWCSYCKELNESTLSDPNVKKKLSKDYITVDINTDQNPDLASQYKIYNLPTVVVLNSNGQEIKRQEQYMSADELLNWL